MLRIFPLLALVMGFAVTAYAQKHSPRAHNVASANVRITYNDPAKTKLIENLLSKMTLEEKLGQLNFLIGDLFNTGPSAKTHDTNQFDDLAARGSMTGLFNTYGAKYVRHLQEVAVQKSRMGIPLLFGADIIHGFRTISPIPLAEAASWDLAAIEASAAMAAREASSAGINWTFAPMVDICRDARWGRVAEGAGEDPFLGSRIAEARVRGFQGKKPADLSASNTIAACVKHFAAYGAPDGGREYNTVDMSERRLREIYLPPYEAAVRAGAATVMTSFNELNGIPATGNTFLLDEVLRREWGFKGLVVSDWQSITEMLNHGNVETRAEAAALALKAGCDMDMMSETYLKDILPLVKNGQISVAMVDNAVRRTLALKYDLGLFADPYRYCDENREKAELYSRQNLDAAHDIAKRSIVLLKNTKKTLPLPKTAAKGRRIALIGPLGRNKAEQNGMWSFFGEAEHVVSVEEGIRSRLSATDTLEVVEGADFYTFTNAERIAEAVAVAKRSDVVLLAVGESAVMSGEAGSRSDIRLPAQQQELVLAVAAVGKPTVLLSFSGHPLDLTAPAAAVQAVVQCWVLGTMTGTAVADVVFGDYNPSGKLPISFPRSVGQVPIYYNYKPTGRMYEGDNTDAPTERVYRSKYRDVANSPLYCFGFGLSYTDFAYSTPELSSKTIRIGDTLTVSCDVKNTGERAGEEVVQLYIRDVVASVTRPIKELKAFEKISLKSGETRKVRFRITSSDLSFYRLDMTYGTEVGDFKVFVGTNSDTQNVATFRLSEK